jgi:hypothetical protein
MLTHMHIKTEKINLERMVCHCCCSHSYRHICTWLILMMMNTCPMTNITSFNLIKTYYNWSFMPSNWLLHYNIWQWTDSQFSFKILCNLFGIISVVIGVRTIIFYTVFHKDISFFSSLPCPFCDANCVSLKRVLVSSHYAQTGFILLAISHRLPFQPTYITDIYLT